MNLFTLTAARSSVRPFVRLSMVRADLHVIHALKTMNDFPFVLCRLFRAMQNCFAGAPKINDFEVFAKFEF